MPFDIYSARHPLMRRSDTIDVIGYNGDRVRISGAGARDDWGPLLAPASTGLWEAPRKTNWGPGMLGRTFSSASPEPRTPVFTVHILNQQGDPMLDSNPDLWHSIYSRWQAMWSTDYETVIQYGSIDGDRKLFLRLEQEVKPFASQQIEGRDPHLFPYGSIVMPTGCENPYYQGSTERFVHEWNGLGDHILKLPYFNPATAEIWPEWYGTDRAAYVLPDWSWGNEEYARGVEDEGKTVWVPHPKAASQLRLGQNFHAITRPDQETLIAEDDTPLTTLLNGTDFEYPIPPGCGEAPEFDDDGTCLNGATIRVVNCTNPDGARIQVDLNRWYSEPFSTPKVF